MAAVIRASAPTRQPPDSRRMRHIRDRRFAKSRQGITGAENSGTAPMPQHWDLAADVVVVGFGAAGVAAAVTAFELGAETIILEKAPRGQEGGNTRVAGQGYLNTSSPDK